MSQDQPLDDLERAYRRCDALEGDVARLRALLKRVYRRSHFRFYPEHKEFCDEIRREIEPHEP